MEIIHESIRDLRSLSEPSYQSWLSALIILDRPSELQLSIRYLLLEDSPFLESLPKTVILSYLMKIHYICGHTRMEDSKETTIFYHRLNIARKSPRAEWYIDNYERTRSLTVEHLL